MRFGSPFSLLPDYLLSAVIT